jgi:hypothetical protein
MSFCRKRGNPLGEPPATVASPVPIPAGYSLVPTPTPAPITAATGGLNLDYKGDPIVGELVPIVELMHSGQVSNPTFVPVNELDSLVGELSDDYDFGLGQLQVQNPHELGRIKAKAKAKAKLPKVAISIAAGAYKALVPAKAPTKKPPVKAAVKAVAKTSKPLVIARKKPTVSPQVQAKSLEQIYAELKAQGKLINLLATRKKLQAEHTRKVGQEGFRENVMDLLHKIEKQCAGDTKGNYFARWNRLKKMTGVAVNQR